MMMGLMGKMALMGPLMMLMIKVKAIKALLLSKLALLMSLAQLMKGKKSGGSGEWFCNWFSWDRLGVDDGEVCLQTWPELNLYSSVLQAKKWSSCTITMEVEARNTEPARRPVGCPDTRQQVGRLVEAPTATRRARTLAAAMPLMLGRKTLTLRVSIDEKCCLPSWSIPSWSYFNPYIWVRYDWRNEVKWLIELFNRIIRWGGGQNVRYLDL